MSSTSTSTGTPANAEQTALTKRVIENLYACAQRGDTAGIVADFHPDMVLHEAESLPWGGTYHGLEAVMTGLGAVFTTYDLSRLEVELVVAEGEWGISRIKLPHQSDPSQDMSMSEHYRVVDGKIVEARVFYWDTAAVRAPASS